MTEVPEHLLRRSRERRTALGLGGREGGAPAGEGEAPARPDGAPAAPAPASTAAVPERSEPPSSAVAAASARPRVPRWAIPVLAALPFWALVYAGTLHVPSAASTDPVLAEGQAVYDAVCRSCHGGSGGGGSGRQLSDGEVLLTFPDARDHVDWVRAGSALVGDGNAYGDPDRPEGQHVAGETPGRLMPPFGESLSEEQIIAVVRYEREVLSGEVGE